MKRKGGCFCGAIRYELLDDPMFVNCCHCTDCQKQTGSAFVINAVLEKKKIRMIKGSVTRTRISLKNSRPHDIYRCKKCLVALWSDYGLRPIRFIRVATLDRCDQMKPDAHVFTRSKIPWVRIPKGMPAFSIFYELKKQWPTNSLKRREQVLGQEV